MKILRGISIAIMILLFCQFPVFVEQYRMHLEGHKKEAERVFTLITQAAKSSDKSLEQYIEKFSLHKDSDIRSQGELMTNAQARYLFLCRATDALDRINPVVRPLVFLGYVDFDIVIETARSFSPGILITKEVLFWGVFGLLFGLFLFSSRPQKARIKDQERFL